jgi:hypothetical protein
MPPEEEVNDEEVTNPIEDEVERQKAIFGYADIDEKAEELKVLFGTDRDSA